MVQRTITYVQPAQKAFPSANSSGILARIHLILTYVRPSSLQISQIQDSLAIFCQQDSQVLTPAIVIQIIKVIQSFHPHIHVREVFRYLPKREAV